MGYVQSLKGIKGNNMKKKNTIEEVYDQYIDREEDY